MHRKRNRPEIKYPEIAVFALSKGSQMNDNIHKSDCYYYMLDKIEQMMRMNNVESDKFGISGYKKMLLRIFHFILRYINTKTLR